MSDRLIARRRLAVAAATLFPLTPCIALAGVDNIVTVVDAQSAVGNVPMPSPIAAFGYDAVNNRVYVAGFSNGDQELRRIDLAGGTVTVQTQVFATPWLRFGRDDDLTLGGGNPTPGAILINPQPIGANPASSLAWITDGAGVVQAGSGTLAIRYPEKTQRLYTYNLQQSSGPIATDVFTSQVTLATLQTAAGQPATSTTSNLARQPAWSGDGQSLYFVDTSPQFGGIWKIAGAGGAAPVRLLNTNTDLNTEPAVLSSGGVDTIFVRGGGATGNVGGIDKITHDGTTTSERTVHVTAAAINDFLENTGTASITSFSMTADSAGNLYFNNTSAIGGSRRGIFKLDPQGRLSKVVGYEERKAVFGSLASGGNPNSNTLRLQPRTTEYVGGSGSFEATQLLYLEQAGVNAVAGAYVFKTGDFNRDNVVDQNDIAAFKAALTLRGVTLAATNPGDHEKFRYDLNGNDEVSWKDVKILQQFYDFLDGDANIDKTVNIADFSALAANFNLTGKKWTEGDFTGDEVVGIADFSLLASNFNLSAPASTARPGAVPEPAVAGGLVAIAVVAGRRRWGVRR